MAANKRTEFQKQEDRVRVSSMLIQRMPIRAITIEINRINQENKKGYTLSHMTIQDDAKIVMRQWREDRKEFIDSIVDRELQTLDYIEFEAWKAWNASKESRQVSKSNEKVIEENCGDPKYLDKILACMDRRQSIIGYSAPKKVEFSGSVGVGIAYLNEEEIIKQRERILKNMAIGKTNEE